MTPIPYDRFISMCHMKFDCKIQTDLRVYHFISPFFNINETKYIKKDIQFSFIFTLL